MLNQMIVSRAAMGTRLDVHRHATFRCGMARFVRRIGRFFA